jgi:hypothetical protein
MVMRSPEDYDKLFPQAKPDPADDYADRAQWKAHPRRK